MAKEEDAQRIAKNYVRRLARNITVRQAILTGSRATGSYLEDSDVDLIVVSDDFSKMQLPERLRYLQKPWKSKIPLEAFGTPSTSSQPCGGKAPTSRKRYGRGLCC